MKSMVLYARIRLLILVVFGLWLPLTMTAQNISTIAGKGGCGYNGDGIPAIVAQLFHPQSIIKDASGNIIFADCGNNLVRKITPSGVISTIAGGAGPITTDRAGNIYFCDYNQVVKIDLSGFTDIVAGLYYPDTFNGEGIAAVSAGLGLIRGLAADALGGLYITSYNRIRYIDSWGTIYTIAGTGAAGYSGDGGVAAYAQFNEPGGLYLDDSGRLFVSDNNSIRVISGGVINRFAGNGSAGFSGDGGAATAARLNSPASFIYDGSSNFYIADAGNHRIRKVSPSGIISTVAGNGNIAYAGDGMAATATSIYWPMGIYADASGGFYLTEWGNHRIRKVNSSGIISTIAGMGNLGYTGDGGMATNAQLFLPSAIAVDQRKNVYVVDTGVNIRKISASGIITTIAGSGTSGYSGDGGAATAARFGLIVSIATDRTGNLYVCDIANQRVRKIDTSGIVKTFAGNGATGFSGDGGQATSATLNGPCSIAIDTAGNVYISDFSNFRVRKVNTSGVITTYAGNGTPGDSLFGGAATAAYIFPQFLTVDRRGNLYISNWYHIRKVLPSGIMVPVTNTSDSILITCRGDGGPASAINIITYGAPFCDKRGNIYFGDGYGHRIRKIDTFGIINTVYGTGTLGYSGDGYSASLATFNGSDNGAFDTSDNLYISESGNNTVRKINNCISPVVASVSGTTTFCIGSHVTLSDSTTGGTWSSGNPSVATVNPSTGVVTGTAVGVATISYAVSNSCGASIRTTFVNVITTDPAGTITGAPSVCAGGTATVWDSGGTSGGSWSRSSAAIASVSGAGGVYGTLHGISTGTDIITYTVTNACGTTFTTRTITVNTTLPTGTITGAATVCIGATATLADSAGTTGGTWSSGATGIATVNSSTGSVRGVSSGTAIITYSLTNICGTSVVTRSIGVITIPSPGSISGTTTFCQGTASTLTASGGSGGGSWSSSATGIATVNSAGVVTGVAGGTAIISYTASNVCGSASATTAVTINPLANAGTISGASTACFGDTIMLHNSVSGGTWSSSNTARASVSSSGIVYGLSTGGVTISYSVTNGCGTVSALHSVTVSTIPGAATISGATTICSGTSASMSASVSGGSWGSTSTHATIGSTGTVHGLSAGVVIISYTLTNSCGSATATMSVGILDTPRAAPITGITSVCSGSVTSLSGATTGGTWSSSDLSVASVSSSGTVTGVATGTAIITYIVSNSCGTDTATNTITVNTLPNAGVISGIDSVCPGDTVRLVNPVATGMWSSSNISLASVSGTGLVTGVSSGSVIIMYIANNMCGADTALFPITVRSSGLCPSGLTIVTSQNKTIRVYPNPANESVTIENAPNCNVIFYDVAGRKVLSATIVTEHFTLDVSSLSMGIYMVDVVDIITGKKVVTKLIKQ